MRVTPKFDSIVALDISKAGGVQTSPEIAWGKDCYLAVWADGRKSGSVIYGTRITSAGQVRDNEGFRIGPAGATFQSNPVVASDGRRFLVVWLASATNSVAGRFVNADGTLGDSVAIRSTEGQAGALRLASCGSGYVLVWTGSAPSFAVKAQILDSAAAPRGAPLTVSESGQHGSIGVGWDGSNYFIVYTSSGGQVRGRTYSKTGQPVGAAFNVSVSPNMQNSCDVAAGPKGKHLVVWSETRDSQADVFGTVTIPPAKQ